MYTIVVAQMQHFSGWAGVVLALLQIPIVIRTTENMLKLVPDSLREAAYALGTPKWKMILSITLKASVSGIITGILQLLLGKPHRFCLLLCQISSGVQI